MHHVSQANHTYNSLTVLDKEEFRSVQQNKYKWTTNQELSDATAYNASGRCCVHCAFTRWQHFSAWNDDMAAIL